MMASEFDQWHINATVHKDRVEEIHYISDPTRNVRRQQCTKIWHVERSLGRGGFGEVRLEKNKEDGQTRAVKRIGNTGAGLTNSDVVKELQALLEFSKPKSREAAVFVDFFGWFRDGSDVFLAMEYVQLGDLERNVAHLGKVPEGEARDIAEQILSGLEIMHAQSFAHRDLKPQNVLVVNGPPQWWVKIADFGLSKRLTDATAFHTRSGSLSYMAPEVLNYLPGSSATSDYTNAVDIWATGCIVYRIICGMVPFPPGTSLMKYCEDKSLFPLEPLFDSGVKSEGFKFLKCLLVTNPNDRPSASKALDHKWITPEPKTFTALPTGSAIPVLEVSGQSTKDSSESGWNTTTHAGLKSVKSSTQLGSSNHNDLYTASSSAPNLGRVHSATSIVETPISQPDSESTIKASVQEPAPQIFSEPTIKAPSLITESGQSVIKPQKSLSDLKNKSVTRVRAIYSFESDEPNDLSFRKGETIEVWGRIEGDWWNGYIGNRKGAFPLNYVEHDVINEQLYPRQATKTRVRAIHEVSGSKPGELSLKPGDVCTILEVRIDGSLVGSLSGPNGSRQGIVSPDAIEDLPMPTPADFYSGKVTKVKALFDFGGDQANDLPFLKGDIIQILEAKEDDWWYGEILGRRGDFPLNYIELLPDIDGIVRYFPSKNSPSDNKVRSSKSESNASNTGPLRIKVIDCTLPVSFKTNPRRGSIFCTFKYNGMDIFSTSENKSSNPTWGDEFSLNLERIQALITCEVYGYIDEKLQELGHADLDLSDIRYFKNFTPQKFISFKDYEVVLNFRALPPWREPTPKEQGRVFNLTLQLSYKSKPLQNQEKRALPSIPAPPSNIPTYSKAPTAVVTTGNILPTNSMSALMLDRSSPQPIKNPRESGERLHIKVNSCHGMPPRNFDFTGHGIFCVLLLDNRPVYETAIKNYPPIWNEEFAVDIDTERMPLLCCSIWYCSTTKANRQLLWRTPNLSLKSLSIFHKSNKVRSMFQDVEIPLDASHGGAREGTLKLKLAYSCNFERPITLPPSQEPIPTYKYLAPNARLSVEVIFSGPRTGISRLAFCKFFYDKKFLYQSKVSDLSWAQATDRFEKDINTTEICGFCCIPYFRANNSSEQKWGDDIFFDLLAILPPTLAAEPLWRDLSIALPGPFNEKTSVQLKLRIGFSAIPPLITKIPDTASLGVPTNLESSMMAPIDRDPSDDPLARGGLERPRRKQIPPWEQTQARMKTYYEPTTAVASQLTDGRTSSAADESVTMDKEDSGTRSNDAFSLKKIWKRGNS